MLYIDPQTHVVQTASDLEEIINQKVKRSVVFTHFSHTVNRLNDKVSGFVIYDHEPEPKDSAIPFFKAMNTAEVINYLVENHLEVSDSTFSNSTDYDPAWRVRVIMDDKEVAIMAIAISILKDKQRYN